MKYTLLGNTGLIVSRMAFGALTLTRGNTMGGIAKVQGADADRLVGQALDAGINFFDTADIYAAGQSEEELGRVLASGRDNVVIATKVMSRMGAPLVQAGLSARHIAWAVDQSLRRLKTDWIDVYIAHNDDPRTPLEETLAALDAVVRSGKARYLGFSNWPAWKVAAALEIQKARGWAQFTHGQMYYSLLGRDIERDLMPMQDRYGIGITAWSPLAGGFLSGKYRQGQAADPADRLAAGQPIPFDPATGFAVVDLLRASAAELGATPAQVALAWLLTRPIDSVILGASRREQLADNLGAVSLVLPAEVVQQLDELTSPPEIYPHWHWRNAADRVALDALG
ncbi:aldo/keto reductase [Novosphingobium flavum]|uniref:Aldo/keto reductase n=1 Tax=Novosphingobium flavum TaxID=1778672 RepID=A0A7X1KKF0_9SPHN|nr:aldo/keto reductase [Novosphingobium flavum]MBC2664213.1 aldo/keto reductase [Novosphingobium flavum]